MLSRAGYNLELELIDPDLLKRGKKIHQMNISTEAISQRVYEKSLLLSLDGSISLRFVKFIH